MVVAIDRRGEHILRLLEQAGVSVRAFAKMLTDNPDHQKVYNWLKGENRPRKDEVWDEMTRVAEREVERRVGLRQLRAMPMKPIRVVGLVAAGDGSINVDTEYGEILVPANLAGEDHLGWTVDGDSMMPSLEPGDIAVFKERRTPRNKYTFLIKTGKGLKCKRLAWNIIDNLWYMESINPSHPAEPLEGELLGLLIGYYRAHGMYEKFEANGDGLRLD